MKTPEEKYLNDPHYHILVNILYHMVAEYQYTPSELREAVIFACTKYELERADLAFKIQQNGSFAPIGRREFEQLKKVENQNNDQTRQNISR